MILAVALPWGVFEKEWGRSRWLWWLAAILISSVNIGVLIINSYPIPRDDNPSGKTWARPAVAFGLMGLGTLWGLCLWPSEKSQKPSDSEAQSENDADVVGAADAAAPRAAEHAAIPLTGDDCNFVQKTLGVALQIRGYNNSGEHCGQTRMATYIQV